jgi:hypothetical protein
MLDTLAAPLTTGADLKIWILVVLGNLFIAVAAIRFFGCWVKKDYGEMITLFVAAVLLVGFIWFPDSTIGVFKGIWSKVSGSPADQAGG